MFKNLIKCIVIFLILLFIGNITVFGALGTGTDGSGQSGGTNTSGKITWTTQFNGIPNFGVKISFVDSQGNRIAGTTPVIYLTDELYDYLASSGLTFRYEVNNRNRVEWIKSGSTTTSWSSASKIQNISVVKKLSVLLNALGDSPFKSQFETNITNAINNRSYSDYTFGFLKKEYHQNMINYDTKIKEFFTAVSKVGGSGINFATINSNDVFLIYEPVTAVNSSSPYELGTTFELANYKSASLDSYGVALKLRLPCASYFHGTMYDQMKDVLSNSAQDQAILNRFTNNQYFGNLIAVPDGDYSNKICNQIGSSYGDRLDATSVKGKVGYGIGVVWFGEYISQSSCEEIYDKIGFENNNTNNTVYSRFQTAFNSNGVQGIYNLYPSGYIDYTDGSGKVDVKWFVNQCTCFGIYDQYATNNISNYMNRNQTVINELSIVIGSRSWFDVPPINETKGWLISEKFDAGSFTSFNTKWQTYSESNNLEWTPWDSTRYNEVLQCGTQEEYWCDEFDEWYTQMINTYPNLFDYPTIRELEYSYLRDFREFNDEYREKLQIMIDAYNVNFFPANDFYWTLELNDSEENGIKHFSYLNHCIAGYRQPNCSTVDNFYQQNEGIDLSGMPCDQLENFDFSAYNNRYNTDISGSWYVSVCGCGSAMSQNCTPSYGLGSCTNGESIVYKDSASGTVDDKYWENCVFNDYGKYDIDPHKVSDKNNNLTYFENELGSDYCEVYCIEDLSASLAVPNVTVEAGSKFEWGSSTVSGSRTCKTKSVEWDKFVEELEAANQAIADAYVAWQVEIKMSNITWTSSSIADCNQVCDTCYEPCTDGSEGSCSYSCNCVYTDFNQTPSSTSESHSVGGKYSASTSDSASIVCGSGSIPTWDPAAKKQAYEEAVAYAKSLIEAMKKCYTWDENDVYEVDPQATIFYSDDINYSYQGELNKNTTYTFNDESVCVSENVDQVTSCSGSSCSVISVGMKNCGGEKRYVLMTREAKTKFTLDDNVYRYILKSNHLSIHPNDLANYDIDNFTTNYIDVGYSNFPVSFSAPDGVYGSKENMGQLDVEYSNLGHIEEGRTMVDTILSGSDIANGTDEEFGKWICEYTVYSDLLPPPDEKNPPGGGGNGDGGPGDINLIYRPIDLYNPFPDIDASGRDTGANWCADNTDCSNDNAVVEAYIHNNRDAEYDELYQLEPMYTFVLTPAIIKEIREYNDENSYTSYTGSLGTTEYFDFKCETGTGRGCISEYLSYLIDITGAKNQPGVCVDDKFRSVSDSDNFYGCRY